MPRQPRHSPHQKSGQRRPHHVTWARCSRNRPDTATIILRRKGLLLIIGITTLLLRLRPAGCA